MVTNNILAKNRLLGAFEVEYCDISYLEVLVLVRNYIHKGHRLLTHPLSGSVKPNETPYKSVVISAEAQSLDTESLSIIEESIACYKKFAAHKKVTLGRPQQSCGYDFLAYNKVPESVLKDFMEIDCSLVSYLAKDQGGLA